jgi:serine/threonine-protein kinase
MKESPEAKNKNNDLSYLKSVGKIAAVLFIAFSIFLTVSTLMLIFRTRPEKEVIVPDMLGKPLPDVLNGISHKGLRCEVKFKDINDIDDGIVLSQYPEGGDVIKENSVIKLLVTRSRMIIDVPKLTGIDLTLAVKRIKNLHYNDKTIAMDTGVISYIPTEKYASNVVMDQAPKPGERVRPSARINLLVSSGKGGADDRMPGVEGQSIDLCLDLLRSKGLDVDFEIIPVKEQANSGIVAGQVPQRGAVISKGQSAVLKVQWSALDRRPYRAYEKFEYQIPADQKAGRYDVVVKDDRSKRICFSKEMKPGQMIRMVFHREGNAELIITREKQPINEIEINVD